MAQVQGNLLRVGTSLITLTVRRFSNVQTGKAKKFVLISQSNDVYTNLALENWLYKNYDFSDRHVLLISKNNPCVVIGNNQNPWVESNVKQLKNISKKGATLARRSGEGSAMYQDEGSLNLTFFSNKECYNSHYNMETLKKALFRKFSLNTKIIQNKNLLLRNRKITDSAHFVGEDNAYQHCSLLVKVNKDDLLEALKTESPVKPHKDGLKYMNLVDENYRVTMDNLISAIGWEYMRTAPLTSHQGGFHLVNPTEQWFPGLQEIRDQLSNWDWVYGKTPKFTLNRSFPVPHHLTKNAQGGYPDINITMIVENARIEDVKMFVPPELLKNGSSGKIEIFPNMKGRKFTEDALKFLEDYFKDAVYADDKDRFVSDCVKQVMTSV